MQLPQDGVEWALITFSVAVPPEIPVTATIDEQTWVACTYDTARPGNWKVLLAGPGVSAVPEGAIQVLTASHLRVKVENDPEEIIRSVGRVTIGG